MQINCNIFDLRRRQKQFAGCEAGIELPRHDSDQSVLIEYNISSAAKLQAFFDFCTFFCVIILLNSEDFDLWINDYCLYRKEWYFYQFIVLICLATTIIKLFVLDLRSHSTAVAGFLNFLVCLFFFFCRSIQAAVIFYGCPPNKTPI